MYCKICVLFGCYEGGRGYQKLGKLVLEKLSDWKDASEKFNSHEQTQFHKTAAMQSNNLTAVHNDKNLSIDILLDNSLKASIQNNRNKIKPIIETIILCGRQGLATRGHNDSGLMDLSVEPSENEDPF